MSSRRTARVASVIREVVSTAILQELRDPRIRNVTVLGADVSPDLRYAKVRISVMGNEKQESLTLHGLNSARGYLQSKVADRVKTRYTPELKFEVDHGVQKSIEASRILREVLPAEEDLPTEATAAEASQPVMEQSLDPLPDEQSAASQEGATGQETSAREVSE